MYKWTNIVIDDGWVLPLTKTLPSFVNKLSSNNAMKDWKPDEKSLDKCQYLQHRDSILRQDTLQGMTYNVGLTFSGGDTTPRFTINIEQDN